MATGRNMQLTKQVGEYLAAAELCRRGLIATTFTGNVPEFDILAINEKRETIPIQVKTIQSGSWQSDVTNFLIIDIKQGVQTIGGKVKLPNPDLVCIYIKLIESGKDEFYILKMKEFQDIVLESYTKWIKSHNYRRPRKPESTHLSVASRELSAYRDNWGLIV